MEIFPKLLQSASFVFGVRFISQVKSKQLAVTLSIHILYIYCVITTLIFFLKNDDDKDVSARVYHVCSTCAAIFTMVKLFRIYMATERIEKLTSEVLRQKSTMTIKKTSAYISNYCICLTVTLISTAIYYTELFIEGQYSVEKIQWLFVDMRDSSECDSMYSLCRYFSYIILHLNRRLESVLDELEDIQSEYPNLKLKIIKDIEQKNIDESISTIREISKLHLNITDIMDDFGKIILFNATLLITRIFMEAVSASHLIFEQINSNSYQALLGMLWTIQLSTCIILVIYSWVSCCYEANRTVIILHDIWNKYTEKKGVDRKLLYFQYISMRFLSCKLKFTAHGLFPLDWTLLHTIVASVTTYTIILIQLQDQS